MAGIGALFLAAFLGIRPAGAPGAGITITPDPVIVVLGIILIVAGVVLMRRRD